MHIPQDELQKFQDGTMNTDEMIHFLEHMEHVTSVWMNFFRMRMPLLSMLHPICRMKF